MAFRALHFGVLALEGVLRSVVFLNAEKRRLPAIDGVAFGTFPLFRAGLELALVGIRGVAIFASGKGDFFLEVVLDVAGGTSKLGMLPEKRVFGFRVIEIKTGEHRFPAAGSVAGIAGLLEFAAVRVKMAGAAGIEFHVLVASGAAGGVGLVALLAGDLGVQSSERIARFGVIEFLCGFPAFDVMAFCAFIAKLALVRVGVTGRARG